MARRTLPLAALMLGALLIAAPPASADPNNNNSAKLRAGLTVPGITEHLSALQAIANANGGIRAAGTSGYDASVDYVVAKATAAGFIVTTQEFSFPFFQELGTPTFAQLTPVPTSYTAGTDFTTMTYSGSGNLTASVQAVDTAATPTNASTSGCQAADFAGFVPGNIALMQRGSCTFALKAANAQAAGASGVIIFNRGTAGFTGSVAGTLGAPGITIPVVGTSFAIGVALAGPGVTVNLVTTTISAIRQAKNVFAQTPTGNTTNVVMAGAHLDSVVPGPGINDNGSGSATLLEIAEQMSKVKPRNAVRFAWWAAEELGLLGSRHYIDTISAAELANLALYLNFDMVASPNFARFVYDGDGSAFGTVGPAGSAAIEQVFTDYLGAQGLANEPTAFDGRSDYGPFIAAGVAAGGLFTGAEGVKTAAQVALYGGTAGVAYDACYHQACDTIANISATGLDQMSDTAAHAIITFAQSTNIVNGKKGKGNFNSWDQIGHQAQQ